MPGCQAGSSLSRGSGRPSHPVPLEMGGMTRRKEVLPAEVLEVWSLEHPQQDQRPHPDLLNQKLGAGGAAGHLSLAGAPGGFVLTEFENRWPCSGSAGLRAEG